MFRFLTVAWSRDRAKNPIERKQDGELDGLVLCFRCAYDFGKQKS